MDQPKDCTTRVCHVSTVHSGLDPRIFWKECVSLASAGYRVTLLAPGIPTGIVQGVTCIPLRHETRRWIRPFMGFAVFWRVFRLHPRVAHFHDPELIPVAVALRIVGLETIYDAHEDLPKQLRQKNWAQRPVLHVAVRARMVAACTCGVGRGTGSLGPHAGCVLAQVVLVASDAQCCIGPDWKKAC